MDRRNDDFEIERRFKLAREQDEARIPSFPEVLARAYAHRAQGPVRRLRLVVAGIASVVVIYAMTYLVWHGRPHRQPVEVEFSALSNWHSPTDFLLKTPGLELLATMPAI